jgi:hypothetical protein
MIQTLMRTYRCWLECLLRRRQAILHRSSHR